MSSKKLLLILSLNVAALAWAADGALIDSPPKSYDGAITRFTNLERESSRALTELGVADTIGLQTGLGYIMDDRVTYKIPTIYWVQTHKNEFVKLNPTEITTIPVAMNNILENVAEYGWDRFVKVSDEEFNEWKKSKGNFAFQYVDTDLKDERQFRQIDPMLYMKAELLYEQAKKDAAAIDLATQKKADAIDDIHQAEDFYVQQQKAINQALEKHFRANVELSMILKLQDLANAAGAKTSRTPASVGEHSGTLMRATTTTTTNSENR